MSMLYFLVPKILVYGLDDSCTNICLSATVFLPLIVETPIDLACDHLLKVVFVLEAMLVLSTHPLLGMSVILNSLSFSTF